MELAIKPCTLDMSYTDMLDFCVEQGVEKIVMMSGLPAGCAGDRTPVWITAFWPPEGQGVLDYRWNEVAIPAWSRLVSMAVGAGHDLQWWREFFSVVACPAMTGMCPWRRKI